MRSSQHRNGPDSQAPGKSPVTSKQIVRSASRSSEARGTDQRAGSGGVTLRNRSAKPSSAPSNDNRGHNHCGYLILIDDRQEQCGDLGGVCCPVLPCLSREAGPAIGVLKTASTACSCGMAARSPRCNSIRRSVSPVEIAIVSSNCMNEAYVGPVGNLSLIHI